MTSFNLLDEPWIPVITGDGVEVWPIREVLLKAQLVAQLNPANTLEWLPTFRLLQAIVTDAFSESPEADWGERFRRGEFDANVIASYLERVHDRFDLLDPVAPFYQVASLEAASGDIKSVLALFPEMAGGNNVPLFSAVLDKDQPTLGLADATRRLLALLAWDTAGLKTGASGDPQMSGGKTTGNPTGPLGLIGPIVPLGRNLFESLMLNTPPQPCGPDDLPAWRRLPTTAEWETRPSRGVLDLLTWQSRRVRLITSPADEGQVTGVIVTGGDRLVGVHPDHEPHTAWRVADPAKGGMARRPIRHQVGKSFWRGMDALLAAEGTTLANAVAWCSSPTRQQALGRSYVLDLRTVAVAYGNQSAVVEHVISDATPMAVLALDEEHGAAVREGLTGMCGQAEAARLALNDLGANLRKARGGESTPWDKGQRPGDQFLASLDGVAREALDALSRCADDPSEALLSWEGAAIAIAWGSARLLLDEDSRATFEGRRSRTEKKSSLINKATAEAYFGGAREAPFVAFEGRGSRTEKKSSFINQATAEAYFRIALEAALPDGFAAWKGYDR